MPTTIVRALCAGLLLVAAACGDSSDDDDEGAATTTTTTTAPVTTTTEPASTSTTAAPTTVVVTTQEQALVAWVADNGGGTYLGPCPAEFDESFPLDGLCSVELVAAEIGRFVLGLGPPFSEIVAYVLLEEGAGGFAVVDDYTPEDPFDLGDAPDWVP